MNMNRTLQKHMVVELFEKAGVSTDTIDIEAELDSSLSLPENLKLLSDRYGIALTLDQKEIENGYYKHLDPDYMMEMENEQIRKVLDEIGDDTTTSKDTHTDQGVMTRLMEHNERFSMRMQKLIEEHEPIDFFSELLFPNVVGKQYDEVRKAVLLSMVSHASMGARTRIHILLVGPPGTGKTIILLWLQSALDAYFVDAQYASKVGLTGDASGKEIVPGALVEADGNIMAIDELDKMSTVDQSALLQSMEEGRYRIIKAKRRDTFNAEVRVVAGANETTKIQRPLLDRFDFVFRLEPPSREERAENSPKLIDQFFGETDDSEVDLLNEYLSWLADYKSETSEEEIKKMKTVVKSYINLTSKDISQVSYRSLELGLLRSANALAKLSKKNIGAEDILGAIFLRDKDLTHEQKRYLTAISLGQL